jgi:hypothetical protein
MTAMNMPAVEAVFPSVAVAQAMDAHQEGSAEDAAMFAKAMKNVEQLNKKLVASTFLVPMLNVAQRDPLGSDLMHGGFAEDVFRSRLNTRLADAMAQGMDFSVTKDLNNRIGQWLGRQKLQRVEEIAALKVNSIG